MDVLHAYPMPILLGLAASAFVAGLARGFSGFGAALIFVPLASAPMATHGLAHPDAELASARAAAAAGVPYTLSTTSSPPPDR